MPGKDEATDGGEEKGEKAPSIVRGALGLAPGRLFFGK